MKLVLYGYIKTRNIFGFIVRIIDALYEFSANTSGYNYFWHDTDRYTLTSKNYIWTYPGQSYNPKSIIVMPESMKVFPTFKTELKDMKAYNCHGICSDYVDEMR
jgi:hypothetical protein